MMSEGEIQAEKLYREQERIGISCGAGIPSPDVLELAKREADEWERAFRAAHQPPNHELFGL